MSHVTYTKCVEWAIKGKPSVLGIVSGAISGLVVVTPGAGYVDQTGAFCMGLLGGIACYFGIQVSPPLPHSHTHTRLLSRPPSLTSLSTAETELCAHTNALSHAKGTLAALVE